MELRDMRKLICLITVLLLCVSFACPIFAAEEFVPSISYKGTPKIATIKDASGQDALGVVRDAAGAVVGYVYEDCMLLTPVANAAGEKDIPAEAKAELLKVYEALNNGTMKLPYGEDVKAEYMVIRDLFDVSWLCSHNHVAALQPEGVVFELTFDLDVAADATVVVMTYKNDAWGEIAGVKNNGDGTVTCTFEHLCPVSISVLNESAGDSDDTGDAFGADLHMWIALMAVSAVAVVAIVVSRRKVQ